MTKGKFYLIIQAALCILLVVLLCAAAVDLYREGTARRAEDPLKPIYTRETVAEKLAPIAPLFLLSLGMTAAGLARGVGDQGTEKPAKGRHPIIPRATPRPRGILRTLLIVAAIACILAGLFNGSARDVLYKAANICTECVGLG